MSDEIVKTDERPKHDGETVYMAGRDWVIPSLSTKQAREFWPEMMEMDKGVTVESLPVKRQTGVKIIHAAMTRNYPDLTLEQVDDMVDLRNLRKIIMIVSATSGLDKSGTAPAA